MYLLFRVIRRCTRIDEDSDAKAIQQDNRQQIRAAKSFTKAQALRIVKVQNWEISIDLDLRR